MKTQNSKEENLNLQICVKIADLISETRNCKSPYPKDPSTSFQLSTGSTSFFTSILKPLFDKCQNFEFSINVLEFIEGCEPALREKWKISYFYCESSENSNDKNEYFATAVKIRGLLIMMQSTLKFKSENLKLRINSTLKDQPKWENFEATSEIRKFEFGFKNQSGSLEIVAEYLEDWPKPKILTQNLGMRPRLQSFDTSEDLKDQNKLNFSFASTETSPKDRLLYRRNSKILSLIASESIYEEKEVGFRLMTSELFQNPESEDENFGHNSFDLEFESNQIEDSEDTSISLYIRQCKDVEGLNLFNDSDIDCIKLVDMWKSY